MATGRNPDPLLAETEHIGTSSFKENNGLKPDDLYRLLRLIFFLVWSVALVGIGAYVHVTTNLNPEPVSREQNIAERGVILMETMTVKPEHLPKGLELDITVAPDYQHWLHGRAAKLYHELPNRRDFILTYRYKRSLKGTVIAPEMQYLSAHAKGGSVEGIIKSMVHFDEKRFLWGYPSLSLKVTNNTEATIYLTEIVIRVHDSKISTDPVLMFSYRNLNVLGIENIGWGKVVDPKVRFGISDSYNAQLVTPKEGNMPYSLEADTFEASLLTDIKKYSPVSLSLGVDIEYSPNGTVRLIRPLHEVFVFGEMTYTAEEGAKYSL